MPVPYSAGIVIDGDAGFVAAVTTALNFVHYRSEVGRMLLSDIGRRSTNLDGRTLYAPFSNQQALTVRIVPTDDPNEVEADADDYRAATVQDIQVVGASAGIPGTGTGSSVRVPLLLSIPEGHVGVVHSRQSTLVHELTHALRMKMGLLHPTPVMDDFEDSEEFFAILVENIFRSGLGWPLRRDHHGWVAMSPPRQYYNERNYTYLFQRFRREMGQFALGLANLDPLQYVYNPYRDFAAVGRTETGW